MIHALHILLLILELSGGTIAGLIAMAFCMATLRAWRGLKVTPWDGVNDIKAATARAAAEGWAHRSLAAFDIAFNVIFLRGQQDETISTHSWRASLEGKMWGKLMTKWLSAIQPNHGPLAATGDLYRATVRVAVLRKVLGLS